MRCVGLLGIIFLIFPLDDLMGRDTTTTLKTREKFTSF